MDIEKHFVHCDCGHHDHLIVFEVWDSPDELPNEFLVHTTMNHFLPWYKRIKRAIEYIFGVQHITHVESIVNEEEMIKLKSFLNKYT